MREEDTSSLRTVQKQLATSAMKTLILLATNSARA